MTQLRKSVRHRLSSLEARLPTGTSPPQGVLIMMSGESSKEPQAAEPDMEDEWEKMLERNNTRASAASASLREAVDKASALHAAQSR